MTKRVLSMAAALIAFGGLASADTIFFGLGGDPNQNYTFTPIGSPAGATDTEPAGPYPGWLGGNVAADDSYFFCITFTKTANWGGTYDGTLSTPSTQTQLEASYLGAELVGMGDQNATMAEKGAISMAIWQITDPAPGDVPRDAAAQSYVTDAVNQFNAGNLNTSEFANTKIFTPSDSGIQTFMMAAAESQVITAAESPVPEPGSIVFILTGLGLIGLGCARRKKLSR